jgi:hypothetical protein
MHDAMAYPNDPCTSNEASASREDRARCRSVIEAFGRPSLVGDGVPLGVANAKVRRNAERLYLATKEQIDLTGRRIKRKLDAGGTSVDDCDAIRR